MRTAGLGILRFILRGDSLSAGDAQTLRTWSAGWSGAGLALLLICLAVYVPGLLSIPPVDRDEARFAQASRQMWESGDFVVPRIQDRPRLNKPPLIYWLQCASVAAFGDAPGRWAHGNIWVFRVPSVLCAIASVLMTWRLGCRMFDPRAAALGAALLAVCPVVAWDAHQARADQLLLLTVVGAQTALWVCWSEARRGRKPRAIWWFLLWFWVGLGVLAKGPITPLIVLLTCAALCWQMRGVKWLSALRPVVGIAIVSAMVAPWVIAVASQVGWNQYFRTIFEETVGRSASAKEGHGGPPGYHLVLLVVLFWPGVLMTGLAVRRAWTSRRHSPEFFLLGGGVPFWAFQELVYTKLPHYTMPIYPALALLSARALFAADSRRLAGLREWGSRLGFAIWAIVGVGIMAAGIALLDLLARNGIDSRGAMTIAAMWYLFIGAAMVWSIRALWRGQYVKAQLRSMVAAVLLLILYMQTLVPAANQFSTSIIAAVNEADPSGTLSVAAVGYQEDSLLFLSRGRIERVSEDAIEQWVSSHPRSIIIRRVDPNQPRSGVFLAEIIGLNYSRGKIETVQIFDGKAR